MSAPQITKTVYVSAFQHKEAGEGIGGFSWCETLAEAEEAANIWRSDPDYEGMIYKKHVPADLSREEITLYIDAQYYDDLNGEKR